MQIVNLLEDKKFLEEYVRLCLNEWGKKEENIEDKISKKIESIMTNNYEKIITAIGLINDNELLGFISLFKYDGDEKRELSPWYATMYVKKEYRGKGYSKILHDSILKKAKSLGYKKIYLKTDLINYYEKMNAKYIETLNNGERLYYIDL